MKKVLVVGAEVMAWIGLAAGRAEAQGPAGAGAASAAASEGGSHSYNPLKWVKRESGKTAGDELDAKTEHSKRLTERLRAQQLLAENMDVKAACGTFKELADCVAALHATHKLGMDFQCVRVNMTHVHSAADPATCKAPEKDEAIGLAQVIRLLKPDANAKAEAKEAEKAAKEDLRETKE
jgi:hypothetical protein